jgi:hypothetical protein
MTKSEVKDAEKKVVILAGRKNGAVRMELAQEVVGGPEGSFKQVFQSLKRQNYCLAVLSNEDYDETTNMLVLTPEGREYAASLLIEESFKDWPEV